jgi:3-dehydroquinate synthase
MLGIFPKGERRRLEALLLRLALPVRLPRSVTPDAVLRRLGADKKTIAGEARFVLLRRIGASVTGVQVPRSLVAAALRLRI